MVLVLENVFAGQIISISDRSPAQIIKIMMMVIDEYYAMTLKSYMSLQVQV